MERPPVLEPVEYTGSVEQKKTIEYGRYLVVRKDGKTHTETFNGTGWAYNNNSIKWFYLPKNSVKEVVHTFDDFGTGIMFPVTKFPPTPAFPNGLVIIDYPDLMVPPKPKS